MKTKYARQIRDGIARARHVQELLDGINLNPTTLGAYALGMVLIRVTNAQTPALEQRAYLHTRSAVHERERAGEADG